jgi:hypothetical protein
MVKIVRQDTAHIACSEIDAIDDDELKITPYILPQFS